MKTKTKILQIPILKLQFPNFPRCPPNFTGSRCEVRVGGTNPNITTTTVRTTPATYQPRCNYTITLLNDGAFTARLYVKYTIDGILQPVFASGPLPFIGQSATVTIPYYAENIFVAGQKLFISYYNIFEDTGLNTSVSCNKCYKVWGVVTGPSWDYYTC